MKNKWIILVIALSLVAVVGIGGKYFMDERSKSKEKESIEVERQSIVVLKNTFANIREVVIEKSGKNPSTGSYSFFVELFNDKNQSVKFSYIFSKDNSEIDSYGIVNENIQREGKTASKVKVIFSDGTEDEI